MSKLPAAAPTAKMLAFAVVAALVTLTIAATIRPIGGGSDRTTYTAELTSASRLEPGDDVRVAGVRVGEVDGVSVTDEGRARVVLGVESDLALTTATRVEIRYLDLTGNRYVALVQPDREGQDPVQDPAETIPVARTSPALDLDDLLDGFKPLLVALSPDDVNALTLDIVRTLQGDGDTVQHLLARTADLTQGLADRDQLIGSVVGNLDQALGAVDGHEDELRSLVRGLRAFTGTLARSRGDVTAALGHLDTMTALLADLVRQIRPATAHDVTQLRKVARVLASAQGQAQLEHALDHLPDKLERLAATAGYGSWFNYYVCGVRVTTGAGIPGIDEQLSALLEKIHLVDTSPRCTS